MPWIWIDRAFGGLTTTRHGLILRLFNAILRPASASFFYSLTIECTPYNVVANAVKVFNPTTTEENNAMFLQVVSFIGNIGNNLITSGQPYLGNFSYGRVWLFRSTGSNLYAYSPTERASLECRRLSFCFLQTTIFSNQLIDGRHGLEIEGKGSKVDFFTNCSST